MSGLARTYLLTAGDCPRNDWAGAMNRFKFSRTRNFVQ